MPTTQSKVRIGTRGSALALAQTALVSNAIEAASPGLTTEIVVVRTTADRAPSLPLSEIGDKALWVVDLEQQLLSGDIDVAVHSMKDLPADLPAGLVIGAVPERECPLDALVLPAAFVSDDIALSNPGYASDRDNEAFINENLNALVSYGARVGTSSDRRQGQLLYWRPDLEVIPVRGNVDTRLRRLEEDEFDAIILAAAGLRRLRLEHRITALFPAIQLVPAAGQGALALEIRENDKRTSEIVRRIHHPGSAVGVMAERAFVRAVAGGCSVPLGVYTQLLPEYLEIYVRAVAPDPENGAEAIEESKMIPLPDRADLFTDLTWAEDLGRTVGAQFLTHGGAEFIERMRISTSTRSMTSISSDSNEPAAHG